MEIGPLSNDKPIQQQAGPKRIEEKTGQQAKETVDRVEISDDARARLAELADLRLQSHGDDAEPTRAGDAGPEEESNHDRIAEIRKRIETGFYDQPEIREKIADKLVDDLDL